MPSNPANESFPEDEVTLRDYWHMLVRRRATALITASVIGLGITLVALLLPNH